MLNSDLNSGGFTYNSTSPMQARANSLDNYFQTGNNTFFGSLANFGQRLFDPNFTAKRSEWQAAQASSDSEYSAERNRMWQDYMYEKNRAFTSDMYEKNRAFAERMSNSAYQRAVADMKKAGINPLLAIHLGGASSPQLASPIISTGQGSFSQSHLPNKSDDNSLIGVLAGEIVKMLAGYVMQSASNGASAMGSIGFGG